MTGTSLAGLRLGGVGTVRRLVPDGTEHEQQTSAARSIVDNGPYSNFGCPPNIHSSAAPPESV